MKGRSYSDIYGEAKATELKAAKSKALRGRVFSEDSKAKMKASALIRKEAGYRPPSRKGICDSAETRMKKKLAHSGRKRGPMSDATKKKISETKKAKFDAIHQKLTDNKEQNINA